MPIVPDDLISSLINSGYLWIPLLVGSLNLGYFMWRTCSAIAQTFFIHGDSLKRFGAGSSWAVVTGASDGIGREFALQLGKAGFNIFLVARNQAQLQKVSREIEQTPGISTKIHIIDFAKATQSDYTVLANEFRNLDIGVLVNNVGTGHSIPTYFADLDREEMENIINVNVTANVRVTHIILPLMIQRNTTDLKRHALIINVGSFSGVIPIPMLQTYSATKSFLGTFSTALAEEVKQHKIAVEHLNTYFVVSKMSKVQRSLFIPMPDKYVSAVLSKIGLACGAANTGRPHTSSPHWGHAVMDWLIHTIPGGPGAFIQTGHRLQQQTRDAALREMDAASKSK